ncbi:MAG: tellurium resistance protein TerX [Beggiatoa sp. IS2]|nr:MAG: tellurium resistance protein TerX [Beggiatoa sp. IS2]
MTEVINLKKGQTIDLRKNARGVDTYDLTSVTIGLGWDIRQKKQGFLGELFGKKEGDYDLDAIAFCLDSNDKVANLGQEAKTSNGMRIPFQKSDVIYFNNLTAPSGNFGVYRNLSKPEIEKKVHQLITAGEYIIHTGDNLTGEGEGDDEQIIVRLNSLPQRIQKIVFLVCIYQGKQKNQHFGMVENAFIRAVDAKGKEITRYSLSSNDTFNNMCSMTFAEIARKNNGWEFKAIGIPHETDLFVQILKQYL